MEKSFIFKIMKLYSWSFLNKKSFRPINRTGKCSFSFHRFPGIADLKMADLYLIVNFFYVFASLIEFAVVSYQSPEKEHKKKATVAPLQVMPPESKSPVKHANSHDHGPEGTLIGANGVFHLTENADDQKSSREK